jgi:hypothetical protein
VVVPVVVPAVESVPVVEDIESVEHGTVLPNGVTGAAGLRVRATDGGLRPPAPSSVEPRGIPTRPTDATEPIPVGEEAEVAGPAKALPLVVAQVPDAVPTVPPPSKTEFETDVLAEDVPIVGLSVPDVVEVVEVVVPKDACGIEPPMPEHGVLAANPSGDAPDVVGLTPGDASSVAPRGMPVGATAEPGPMPSGDVMPSGDPGEICAKAEPQPTRSAVRAEIQMRVIALPILTKLRYRPWSSRVEIGPLRRTFHRTNIRRIY